MPVILVEIVKPLGISTIVNALHQAGLTHQHLRARVQQLNKCPYHLKINLQINRSSLFV